VIKIELIKKIKGDKFLYLIHGEETYLIKKLMHDIKNKFITRKEFIDMNFNFLLEESNPQKIIDCAESLPFENKFRLIFIKNSNLFTSGKKHETNLLANLITKISKSSLIFFFENKIDKRNKLFKQIMNLGEILEVKKLTQKKLITWLINICEQEKILLSQEDAKFILEITNNDMENLHNEINKLLDYKISSLNKNITREDINFICVKSSDANIFELTNAIANKNLDLALSLYKNLLLSKEQPVFILALIARQFILILQVKILHQENKNLFEIARFINTKEFIARDYINRSKNFSLEKLIKIIKQLAEYDYKIKIGKLQDNLALENLIFEYAQNFI